MGSITIRNVDDEIKRGARLAAARHGRSMEAEIRALLERTYRSPEDERAERIRAMSGTEFVAHLVAVANGATLDIPDREHEEIAFPDL